MGKLSGRTQITDADLTNDCVVHVVKPAYPSPLSFKATVEQLRGTLGLNFSQYRASISEIRTASSIPIQLAPSPGAGKFIQVVSASTKLLWVTGNTPYSETQMQIGFPGLASSQASAGGLNSTSLYFTQFEIQTGNSIQENTPLYFTTPADDSAGGDSEVDIYVFYKIITV